MLPISDEYFYLATIYCSVGNNNYVSWIYRKKEDVNGPFIYLSRMRESDSDDPWDKNDKKEWTKEIVECKSDDDMLKRINFICEVLGRLPKYDHTIFDVTLIMGDHIEFQRKVATLPYVHAKIVDRDDAKDYFKHSDAVCPERYVDQPTKTMMEVIRESEMEDE